MASRHLNRRTFLCSLGSVTGLGLIAACHPGKNGTPEASQAPTPMSTMPTIPIVGEWDSSGAQLNEGLTTQTSEIALPAAFRTPLPIPTKLAPRRSSDTDYYNLVQREATVTVIPGTRTRMWTYNGTFPGPTLVSQRGRRTVVTHHNELPVPTVVHLHGGRTPADQDGYATDLLLPIGMAAPAAFPGVRGMQMTDREARITSGSRDYVYPMEQRAATLWYHDHRMGFTGPAVNRGLAGFHLVHDDEELGLPLPKGDRDIPLMICDRAFAADGSFLYPSTDPTLLNTPGLTGGSSKGFMGDVVLVNGAPWPRLEVGAGRYRFRILNASNARSYQLALQTERGPLPFTQVGSDGGLLTNPIERTDIVIGPAQRFDVIVDFGKIGPGRTVTLANSAGTGRVASVMQFAITRAMTDHTSVPDQLSASSEAVFGAVENRRSMAFSYRDGMWVINGQPFDPSSIQATVRAGQTELWTISSNFHHPVHLHGARLQVVARNGGSPGSFDQGLKDTVLLGPGETVSVLVQFQDFKGRYMFHCHNLEHEDMAMMANFYIGA